MRSACWWPVAIESLLPGTNPGAESASQQSLGSKPWEKQGLEPALKGATVAVPPFQGWYRSSQPRASAASQPRPGLCCGALSALGCLAWGAFSAWMPNLTRFQRCDFRDSPFMPRPRSEGNGSLSNQLLRDTRVPVEKIEGTVAAGFAANYRILVI